ncbi:hypothetical protein ETD86_13215 [Nonomuraea turkmeniaca]|uniref:Glycosyl transferase family 28 C-terminal domain-containing protein n=1 Tax=Nonomuraea turkmeniaca TaxID=103838 RepID=A0A5S4FP49_9ACTN|nr:hypothetical protein [Nonomuraea turkmeniaca]TMR21981.1 hypothetical protein ETD86_13215 [Nonomuraea turkmeniaca]
MSPTVAFFFKARHGFGHVRRTVLIADELRRLAPDSEIFLVGQVRSLLPLRGTPHRVISFPHMHRLPSDAMETALRDLLNNVIAEIRPDLIVEDTFPDRNHLFLPAAREVPKVLVLRKMSGIFFERMRRRGELSHYDRILVAQSWADFAMTGHSPDSLLLAEHSARFRFLGPVFHSPPPSEIAFVRRVYGRQPLVVVAAGAGGDTGNQGYVERLFTSMSAVAARFLDRAVPARFILVTGPYYDGVAPPALPNVTTVPYEPSLAALLHAAKVAVIRPGFNSLHEAVSGPARVVLVPGHNTAEDQWGDARRLSAADGIDVTHHNDVDGLETLVLAGLAAPPRVPSGTPRPAQGELAAALLEEAGRHSVPWTPGPQGRVFLLVGGLGTADRHATAEAALPGAARVGAHVSVFDPTLLDARPLEANPPGSAGPTQGTLLLLDAGPDIDVTPASLHARGVRVVFLPDRDDYDDQAGPHQDDWLRGHPPPGHGLLPVRLHHLRATESRPGEFPYRVERLRERSPLPAVYLDVSAIASSERLRVYLQDLAAWLAASGLTLSGLRDFVSRAATVRLMGGTTS